MSTINCGDGKVQWLDSSHREPSTTEQKSIVDILKTGVDEITVSIMQNKSEQQTYGLFALALVTVAVHGHNPTELLFDQGKMRPHLIESLQKMEASMFLVIKTQMKRRETLKRITILVYCICQLPDSGSQMVECTGCLKWLLKPRIRLNGILGTRLELLRRYNYLIDNVQKATITAS